MKKNRLDFAFATPLIKIENLNLFKYFFLQFNQAKIRAIDKYDYRYIYIITR